MRTVRILAACLGLAAAAPVRAHAAADPFCADQSTTVGIADCFMAQARQWDGRLNAAYKALQSRIDPEQRQKLLAAQRLWIQFRDANCAFYGAREGTMRVIEAAQCQRDMTEARTRELDGAMRGD